MNTIDRLKALEKAATPAPCELYNDEWTCAIKVGEVYMQAPYQPPHGRGECAKWRADGALFAEARNALPALLKVAEAAVLVKAANTRRANALVQDRCERTDYEQSMGHACDQLTRALAELEAQ